MPTSRMRSTACVHASFRLRLRDLAASAT
jgi:hypothetical protein